MLPVKNWTLVPCCRHARRLNNAVGPRAMLGLWSNGTCYAPAKCKRCSAAVIKEGIATFRGNGGQLSSGCRASRGAIELSLHRPVSVSYTHLTLPTSDLV